MNGVVGFAGGFGDSFIRNFKAITVDLPSTVAGLGTLAVLAAPNNYGGQLQLAMGISQAANDAVTTWQQGDIKVRANMIGNGVGEVVFGVLLSRGGGAASEISTIGRLTKVSKIGRNAASLSIETESILSKGDFQRIQNAATRIKKTISVVGSRANGTAGAYSDWDYVIEGLNNKLWKKIKNSLPGSKSVIDNMPRNIDIFHGPVNTNLPHITISPRH